jgi:hypothetical protein
VDRSHRAHAPLFGTRLEQMGRGVPMMAAALSMHGRPQPDRHRRSARRPFVRDAGRRTTMRSTAPRPPLSPVFDSASRDQEGQRALAGSLPSWKRCSQWTARPRPMCAAIYLPAARDDGRRPRTGTGTAP